MNHPAGTADNSPSASPSDGTSLLIISNSSLESGSDSAALAGTAIRSGNGHDKRIKTAKIEKFSISPQISLTIRRNDLIFKITELFTLAAEKVSCWVTLEIHSLAIRLWFYQIAIFLSSRWQMIERWLDGDFERLFFSFFDFRNSFDIHQKKFKTQKILQCRQVKI